MSDIFVPSLRNRIRAMNTLWKRAVSDTTLEHVNHHERPGVLPIAFSLSHCMRAQDASISLFFLREPPLCERGGWAQRIGVNVDRLGREESLEEVERLRFADLSAWVAYQSRVIETTSRVLETVTHETLGEVVMPALPPEMQNILSGIVAGQGNPTRKLEVLECFVYQHGLRHMGEMEHARALLGLGGMTT